MKHDWEYKKLGEVCTIVGGSTPKTNIATYWDGPHPWITPAELDGSRYINKTERTITDDALIHTKQPLLPIGTVLLSSRAPIGKLAITKIPMYCNQGFKNIVVRDGIFNEYVYWYLLFKREYIISLGRGATFKEISKSITESIPIPVPPLSVQEQIASELEKVSEVIEKKKQQVKELDTLAQSIFYDMFGDPVENEKGWEVKKVIDVVTFQRGYDLPVQNRNANGGIPIFGANGIVGYHSESMSQRGIITGRSGSLGDVFVSKKPYWPLNTSLFSKDTHGNDIVYLMYLVRYFDLKRYKQGSGVPTLNRNSFHHEPIIDVPLPLQRSFAEKIEAIERQKGLINRSIKEVQTLFDSRMDYYFGE